MRDGEASAPQKQRVLLRSAGHPEKHPSPRQTRTSLGSRRLFQPVEFSTAVQPQTWLEKRSSANSPWVFFFEYLLLICAPHLRFNSKHIPQPRGSPPSHTFILCSSFSFYHHVWILLQAPTFILGYFLWSFCCTWRDFLPCSFIIEQGLHLGFSDKASSAPSLVLTPGLPPATLVNLSCSASLSLGHLLQDSSQHFLQRSVMPR